MAGNGVLGRAVAACAVLVLGGIPGIQGAWGEVIISEVMYNPASDEKPPAKTEWVEIYNNSDEPADVSGWHLADEDGQTAGLPAGTMLAGKSAMVLVPGECTVEMFRAAWGEGVTVFPVTGWGKGGMSQLANSPGADNEKLALRDSGGTVIDAVHYKAEEPWPKTGKGGSIYLHPSALNGVMNDDGSNWRISEAETHGAKQATATEVFDARDAGSPGMVAE